VLLVTLDTTRVDHLSCYGYGPGTSPYLDQLAAEGVRFERAISSSALTAMAHASILTGLNPYRHGLRVFFGPTGNFLEDHHDTAASLLSQAGYRTAAFISAFTASHSYGLDLGFDTFELGLEDQSERAGTPEQRVKKQKWNQRARVGEGQRRADATTDAALDWITADDRPFFLWVHYFDPHDNSLLPPQEATDAFEQQFAARYEHLKAGRRKTLTRYDAEIHYMDAQVGRILEALQHNNRYDHTVIVVVADHGQGLGDHNWQQHRLLYQEQIHIPLVVRLPDGPQGRVIANQVRNIDLLPTILEVCGQPVPEGIEGRSLLALIAGHEEAPRLAYAEALNTLDTHAPDRLPDEQRDLLFCIMDQRWKLIHHQQHPEHSELYDLERDPKEKHNVLAEHAAERDRLLQALTDLGAQEIELIERNEPMAEGMENALRALGYIE
jgi:arylsulfatase A-like enzyme